MLDPAFPIASVVWYGTHPLVQRPTRRFGVPELAGWGGALTDEADVEALLWTLDNVITLLVMLGYEIPEIGVRVPVAGGAMPAASILLDARRMEIRQGVAGTMPAPLVTSGGVALWLAPGGLALPVGDVTVLLGLEIVQQSSPTTAGWLHLIVNDGPDRPWTRDLMERCEALIVVLLDALVVADPAGNTSALPLNLGFASVFVASTWRAAPVLDPGELLGTGLADLAQAVAQAVRDEFTLLVSRESMGSICPANDSLGLMADPLGIIGLALDDAWATLDLIAALQAPDAVPVDSALLLPASAFAELSLFRCLMLLQLRGTVDLIEPWRASATLHKRAAMALASIDAQRQVGLEGALAQPVGALAAGTAGNQPDDVRRVQRYLNRVARRTSAVPLLADAAIVAETPPPGAAGPIAVAGLAQTIASIRRFQSELTLATNGRVANADGTANAMNGVVGCQYSFPPHGWQPAFTARFRATTRPAGERRRETLGFVGSILVGAEPDQTFLDAGLLADQIVALRFVSGHEAGFDGINTWDTAHFTWGFIQFAGTGGFPPLMAHIKRSDPTLFNEHFGRFGVDVEYTLDAQGLTNNEIVTLAAPGAAAVSRGDAAMDAIGDSPLHAALFVRAAQHPTIRWRQVESAAQQYVGPALAARARNSTVGAILSSQRGMATAIDRMVQEGNVARVVRAIDAVANAQGLNTLAAIQAQEGAILDFIVADAAALETINTEMTSVHAALERVNVATQANPAPTVAAVMAGADFQAAVAAAVNADAQSTTRPGMEARVAAVASALRPAVAPATLAVLQTIVTTQRAAAGEIAQLTRFESGIHDRLNNIRNSALIGP